MATQFDAHTSYTSAQQAESFADIERLNAFFGIIGLYGESPSSTNTKAFIAVLQSEARNGTLATGPLIGALLNSTVTCPVLRSVNVRSVFGCLISSPTKGPFTFVGYVQAADATEWQASIRSGLKPAFLCSVNFDVAEQAVALQIGATCN